MLRNLSQSRNALAMLLIAAALLLRMAVPQGYMLESGADGIEIAVCNSDQMLVIPMEDDGQADDGEQPEICSFASHSTPNLLSDGTAEPALPQLAEAAYDAVREIALSPDGPRLIPPARGPPLTV